MARRKAVVEQPAPLLTAAGRYEQLSISRSPILEQGRTCSRLTIPSLLPPEGMSDATRLYQPYQSVGARGVVNLAAKLLLALFPPGSSFFRLKVEESVMKKLIDKAKSAGVKDAEGQVEEALSLHERAVTTRLELKNTRPALSETFKHLLVVGNALLQMLPDGRMKMHPLSHYVVKRDTEGEVIEIVVREGLSRRTLPAAVKEIVAKSSDNDNRDVLDTIWLYTWISREESGATSVHQEVLGTVIPETHGTYPKDNPSWFALRWTPISGADYGRGRCEEFLGDLLSLESLSQSIVTFAANAAKIVWMVSEGGTTQRKKIAKAPSGAVIEGNAKDVTVLAMEKFADFQVAKATVDDIKQSLKEAFLLNSSIQRQAERVTAEEIRFMAGELEQALGGTYSVLSQELQRPIVIRLMTILQKEGKLPTLPKDYVSPQIITGLDGLGRSNDMQKLDILLQGAGQNFGPEAVAEYTNVGAYLKRRAAMLAIDVDGIVRSEEEVQQSRAAQQQQALLQKVAPAGVKAMSDQAVAAQQAASADQQQQ